MPRPPMASPDILEYVRRFLSPLRGQPRSSLLDYEDPEARRRHRCHPAQGPSGVREVTEDPGAAPQRAVSPWTHRILRRHQRREPSVHATLDDLANSHRALGRYPEARGLHEETLARRKAKFAPHTRTLCSAWRTWRPTRSSSIVAPMPCRSSTNASGEQWPASRSSQASLAW
jgi:hypothetical protein